MATSSSNDSSFSPPLSKRVRLSLEDGDRAQLAKKLAASGAAATSQLKSEFPLRSLEDFYKDCPTYRLPVEVGSFSLDNQGKQHLDRTQLRYLALPPPSSRLNFDLKVGYDKYVPSPRSVPAEKLNPILRWIAMNGDCFRPKPFSPKSPEKAQDGSGGVGGGVKATDPMGRRVSVGEVVSSVPTSPSKDRYSNYYTMTI